MQKKEETILKEILWGERPINHLQFVKINLQKVGSDYHIENPRDLSVSAGPVDVARGLLRYQKEPAKLVEWAHFLLQATDLYGLELHKSDEGKGLQAELEHLAGGGPVHSEVLDQARVLVPNFPKKRALGEPEQPGAPT